MWVVSRATEFGRLQEDTIQLCASTGRPFGGLALEQREAAVAWRGAVRRLEDGNDKLAPAEEAIVA